MREAVGEDPVCEVVPAPCGATSTSSAMTRETIASARYSLLRLVSPRVQLSTFAARLANNAPTTSRGPQSVPTAMAVRPARVSTCAPSAVRGTVTTTASYGSQNVTS